MARPKKSLLHFNIDDYLNPYLPHVPIERLPYPIAHFLGYRKQQHKEVPAVFIWIWAFIGAFTGIILVEVIFKYSPVIQQYNPPIIIASLVSPISPIAPPLLRNPNPTQPNPNAILTQHKGASAILDYNVIHTPLSQPRNAFLGQTLSALTGVIITKLFQLSPSFSSLSWVAGALACATASLVMGVTNTVHPPGGATAVLAATNAEIVALGWMFVPLTMLGSAVMLAVALLVNNLQRQYPNYWWTATDLRRTKEVDIEKVPSSSPEIQKVSSKSSGSRASDTTLRPGEADVETREKVLDADLEKIVIEPDRLLLPDSLHLNREELELLARLQARMRRDIATDERDGLEDGGEKPIG